MRVGVLLILLVAALLPALAMATATALPAKATVPAPDSAAIASKLPYQTLYAGDAFYAAELAKKGVQGEAVLEVRLSGDGKAIGARIISSSKSAALDKNALAYIHSGRWRLPDNGLKYFAGVYSLTIIFIKDSMLTINAKTCADFSADVLYFRSISKQKSLKNLGALDLIANMYTVQLIKNHDVDGSLQLVKNLDAINAEVVTACTKKPAAALIKTYAKVSARYGIKF